jgi:hypothetical protein
MFVRVAMIADPVVRVGMRRTAALVRVGRWRVHAGNRRIFHKWDAHVCDAIVGGRDSKAREGDKISKRLGAIRPDWEVPTPDFQSDSNPKNDMLNSSMYVGQLAYISV